MSRDAGLCCVWNCGRGGGRGSLSTALRFGRDAGGGRDRTRESGNPESGFGCSGVCGAGARAGCSRGGRRRRRRGRGGYRRGPTKRSEVDAFPAAVANGTGALEAGKLAGREGNADPLFGEEIGVREVTVGCICCSFLAGQESAGGRDPWRIPARPRGGPCRRRRPREPRGQRRWRPFCPSRGVSGRVCQHGAPVTTPMASVAQRSISTRRRVACGPG